jgi:hypothetical protein
MANLPPFRLKSRKPLWKEEFLMQPFSKSDYWKAAWQDVDIFNKNLIEDPVTLGFSPNVPLQESLVAYKIPSFAGAKTSARATPSRIFHLIRRIFTHFFLF